MVRFFKLSEIVFNRGKAYLNTQPFSGKIKTILRKGDQVELQYENGTIERVIRQGEKNYVKEFADNGIFTYPANVYRGVRRGLIQGSYSKNPTSRLIYEDANTSILYDSTDTIKSVVYKSDTKNIVYKNYSESVTDEIGNQISGEFLILERGKVIDTIKQEQNLSEKDILSAIKDFLNLT